MKKSDVEKDAQVDNMNPKTDDNPPEDIFDTEEIRIEELAIDGICGVY